MIARRGAALFDSGKDCGADANIAKLLASEATWHAAEAAMQTFGGFAYAREYDVERKWRECRLYQSAPISTNSSWAMSGNTCSACPAPIEASVPEAHPVEVARQLIGGALGGDEQAGLAEVLNRGRR